MALLDLQGLEAPRFTDCGHVSALSVLSCCELGSTLSVAHCH